MRLRRRLRASRATAAARSPASTVAKSIEVARARARPSLTGFDHRLPRGLRRVTCPSPATAVPSSTAATCSSTSTTWAAPSTRSLCVTAPGCCRQHFESVSPALGWVGSRQPRRCGRRGSSPSSSRRPRDLSHVQVGGSFHLFPNALRALEWAGLSEALYASIDDSAYLTTQTFQAQDGKLLVEWPIGRDMDLPTRRRRARRGPRGAGARRGHPPRLGRRGLGGRRRRRHRPARRRRQ